MKKFLIALLVFVLVTASIFYMMKAIYNTDAYHAETKDFYER